MQNPRNEHSLLLRLVTPDQEPIELECDSVHVTLRDDSHGHGGGSYGIRHGHAKTILAMGAGPLTALLEGKTLLRCTCSEGFARIENSTVIVVTEGIRLDER